MTKKGFCKKCNLEMIYCNWGRHLKTQKHVKNNPEQTAKLFRSGRPRLYNDRPSRLCENCNIDIVSQTGISI